MSWKFWQQNAGWLALAVMWLVFFSPIISGQYVYFLDDLKIIYYPLELEYAKFQSAWELPHWSSLFGFGQPLISWGQLGFFTPLHLILRAAQVPPLALLQVSVAVYYVLGLFGAYLFGRQQKLAQAPSCLFASIFVFCGFSIGHLNHVNFYTSTMLLPWLLLAATALIKKPTLLITAAVAALAAAMAVSGQPQVITYSFSIAIIILTPILASHIRTVRRHKPKKIWRYSGTAVASTLAAGIISLSIASINILPLREFLPQTERNQTLPPEEYFEFSYPPHHAITLLLPYFYGNHESYWGAKGFQELAAYVGFAPLILAATAAVNWKSHKSIRLSALTLIGLAAIMATGKYSPVYTALVNHNLLPPLSVPGRFVFFFDVGIALLASAGLSDVLRGELSLKKNRLLATLSIAAAGITAFAPFFMSLANDGRSFEQFMSLFGTNSWQLIPLLIGALAIPLIIIHIHSQAPNKKPMQIAVLGTAVLPLLLYSWNYNPRMPATLARVENKFAKQISDYSRSHPVPARLYSHERLLQTTPVNKNIRRTDTISPGFWVIQPLLATKDNLECVLVDLNIRDARQGDLQVSIHKNLNDAPVRALSVNTGNLSSSKPNPLCFEPILQSANQTFYIRITSFIPTGVELTYKKLVDSPLQAHFVRVPVPTPDQISRSKKTAQLNIEPKYTTLIDREAAMLARHLQVTANASGARWIGALSIRPYREFIEKFFANDGEIIDGDGKHAIERNRTILNMAGITHLIQFLPPEATDTMPEAGFNLEDSYNTGEKEVRLYTNPAAWPKAFLVPQAQFIPAADEIRYAMSLPSFDAKQTVFLSGEIPPVIPALQPDPAIFAGTATITNYKDTRVDITTESTTDSYLVVTDSSSQQWQTFIDGRQASHLVAYSFFKAAQVPAGTHTVSFRYYSPAVAKAKIAASLGLASLLAMTILGAYNFKKNTPT